MTVPRIPTDASRAECDKVLAAILDAGSGGKTCDEVEVHLGLSHQNAAARISFLVRVRSIHQTAERRKSRGGVMARVYRAGAPVVKAEQLPLVGLAPPPRRR